MPEPTVEQLHRALSRHVSATGEVFPSALRLIEAEEHWSGHLWNVLRVVMADLDTMRYLAGGDRPDEVAECAARWADSGLSPEDIDLVTKNGGYDPDPFVALAGAGLLEAALCRADGQPRIVKGERAGAWISDQFALASAEDTVARVTRMIADTEVAAS